MSNQVDMQFAEKFYDEEKWDLVVSQVHQERQGWTNNQLLDELKNLPPMPDENDPAWKYSQTWYNAEIYLAQVDAAVERKLEESIPFIYGLASLGEPGEILRGVFKNGISQIVAGDETKFVKYTLDAYNSPRAGTRYWAVHNLGYFISNPQVEQALKRALQDSESGIRAMAEEALAANDTCCTFRSE